MNIADQVRLKLQLKEDTEVEYKSAAGGFPKAEFWRSFSALANTNGGTIVLGVKGWKDNGWSTPIVEEKNNPDRIETYLKLGNSKNITTETTTNTTETTTNTTETIFKIIGNNPKVTAKEIASVCGITEDGVAYHIKKLKQSGRIIRIGGSRNGGEWKIIK
jgi:predicted HTH transcriptional regulator